MNAKQFLTLSATIIALGAIGTLVLNSDPDYFIGFELDVTGDEGIEYIDGAGHYCTDDYVMLYAEVKDGYLFDGWYDEDGKLLCEDQDYDFYAKNVKYFARTAKGAYVSISHMDGLVVSESRTYPLGETVRVVAVDCGRGMPSFTGWYGQDGALLSKSRSYTFTATEDMRLVAKTDSRFFEGDERLDWRIDLGSSLRNVTVYLYDKYSGDLVADYGGSLSGTAYLIPGEYCVEAVGTLYDGTEVKKTALYKLDGDIKRMYYWIYDRDVCHIEWTALADDYRRFLNSEADRWPYNERDEREFIDYRSKSIVSLAEALDECTSGMTDLEKAECVLKFVQHCTEYQYDEEYSGQGEYWKYPMETIVQRCGDCEDTSLLYACLVAAMGYGSAVLIYDGYEYSGMGHAAAGIALDRVPGGYSYNIDGKKYYYCETTSDTMGVGEDIEEYDTARYILVK
jgi:hypothetical protein